MVEERHAESSDVEGAKISDFDLSRLSQSLKLIADAICSEFVNWHQGYHHWAQMQMMNLQPVPPQAQMEYEQRLHAVIGALARFGEAADILAKAGANELKQFVDGRLDGLRGMVASGREAQMQMAQDNAAANRKTQDIWNQMNQDNLAAGAARQDIRNETFNDIYSKNAAGLRARSASFNEGVEDYIESLRDD